MRVNQKIGFTVLAAMVLGLAGCANVRTPIEAETTLIAPGDAVACQQIAIASDDIAARAMDMPVELLHKLKRVAATDNAGVCKLRTEERSTLLIAERNRTRPPKAQRVAARAASREFILRWDADDFGRQPNTTQILAADSLRKKMAVDADAKAKAAGISQNRWTALGPGNVGGRLRAILIDPRDVNRILVGAASGGIWRSSDGGQSFLPVNDFSGNLTIGSMARDPNNPDVIYAGTGELYALNGVGMFKSVDGGTTWNFLPNTSTDAANPLGGAWTFINRIGVSAANSNIVVAATTTSIMRSADGGQTWARVFNEPTLDLQVDPFNSNNMLAGLNTGTVAFSRDAGLTWQTPAVPLIPSAQNVRAEVTYARSRQNVAYASLNTNTGELWKTVDGGVTWARVSVAGHLVAAGDYNNCIWVDPLDDSHIVVGGIDLFRSVNGGLNFTQISSWGAAGPGLPQPHADHHVLVSPPNYSPTNRVLYVGNDGGIYRSTDIVLASHSSTSTWQNLNNGLAVTQFYSGAGSAAAGGRIVGGTQDNGDLQRVDNSRWNMIGGGDGGMMAVDPVSDNTRYGEYVYGMVRRYIGSEQQDICDGITETARICNGTRQANFIAPLKLDPNDRDRLFVGANSLWLSQNARTADAPTWRAIRPPVALGTSPNHFINAVEIARGNGDLIWLGYNDTGDPDVPAHLYKSTDGRSTAPTWTLMTRPDMPSSSVSRITVDHENHNRVWVTYSGFAQDRAWVTEDGGTTWRSISAGLPAVSLFDIKRHPSQRDWLYVAAANGVYTSENGGVTWSSANDGPNSVRVMELFWFDNETLVAATFGRGMFQIKVASPATGPLNYSDMWWAGAAEDGWGMSIQQHANGVQFNAIYVYDAEGLPRWYVMPGGTWNANFTSYTGAIYQPRSAPLNTYNTGQFQVGASPGNVTLTFTGANTATLAYTINGISGTKAIQRQQFAAGVAPFNVSDLWWAGSAENGWGINFAQQAGTIFGVWYTYAPDGRNTWFVWPGGTWSGNTYTGPLYSTTGSPWLGVAYDRTRFRVNAVGTLSVNFSNANAATMTYNFNSGPYAGTSQTKPLTRQAY